MTSTDPPPDPPPTPAPLPMPADAWRTAILRSDLRREVKIVACQAAHWAVPPTACVLPAPSPGALADASELPLSTVREALAELRRTRWILRGTGDDGRPVVLLNDPRRDDLA
jgi:hypothetical protein